MVTCYSILNYCHELMHNTANWAGNDKPVDRFGHQLKMSQVHLLKKILYSREFSCPLSIIEYDILDEYLRTLWVRLLNVLACLWACCKQAFLTTLVANTVTRNKWTPRCCMDRYGTSRHRKKVVRMRILIFHIMTQCTRGCLHCGSLNLP